MTNPNQMPAGSITAANLDEVKTSDLLKEVISRGIIPNEYKLFFQNTLQRDRRIEELERMLDQRRQLVTEFAERVADLEGQLEEARSRSLRGDNEQH